MILTVFAWSALEKALSPKQSDTNELLVSPRASYDAFFYANLHTTQIVMLRKRFHHLGDRKRSLGYQHCFWSTYWPSLSFPRGPWPKIMSDVLTCHRSFSREEEGCFCCSMDAYIHVATIQQPRSILVSRRENSKTGAGVIYKLSRQKPRDRWKSDRWCSPNVNRWRMYVFIFKSHQHGRRMISFHFPTGPG